MSEKILPDPKEQRHSSWAVSMYTFTSAICSAGLVIVLFIAAVFSGFLKAFHGDDAVGLPEEEDDDLATDCYPDMKGLKLTSDLGYYARQLDLELKEYRVQTKDGFILKLQRLIDPKQSDEDRSKLKPMLCQHGLLSSSGCFLTPGSRSLAVYFLKQGFDVWLGNNRSGFEPVHAVYEGNLMHSEQYWDWDIRDLAFYDLTCLIDNVLANSPNFNKLVLVGHSQGCTQSFLMLRTPDLAPTHAKIEYFVALAPAIYPGVLFHEAKFLKFMCSRPKLGFKLFFGVCCFLNFIVQTRNRFCEWPIFGSMCVKMFNFLFNWNGNLWNQNQKLWRIHFIFNVSYVSSKLMTWWLSYWREDSFRNELVPKAAFTDKQHFKVTDDKKYDVQDSQTFFPFKQSWFSDNTSNAVPLLVFNADEDNLVDGKRLATHLETFEPRYKINENLHIYNIDKYSHLDVLWSNTVVKDIGYEIVRMINDI